MTKQGCFIALEGGEGAGKTTLSARLTTWLAEQGITLRSEREPGGTKVGELIRPLLKGQNPLYADLTEGEALAGFCFVRVAYVREVVKPTLAKGEWLLSDRFAFSTLVYQGLAGGVSFELVKSLTDAAVGDNWPDLTLILDCPVDIAMARRMAEGSDGTRYEDKGTAFHEKVRAGYLKMLELYPDHTVKLDASQEPDAVFAQAKAVLAARFGLKA